MLIFTGNIEKGILDITANQKLFSEFSRRHSLHLTPAFPDPEKISIHSPNILEADIRFLSYIYNYAYLPDPDVENALLYPLCINRWHTSPTHYTKRSGWKNYQLIYTHAGSGILNAANRVFYLKPETLCLLNCNPYHYYFSTDSDGWEYSFIHFAGPSTDFFYRAIAKNGFVFNHLAGTDIKKMYDSFPIIAKENPPDFDLRFHLRMTELLTELSVSTPVQPETIMPDWLSKAQAYIIENYNRDWTISQLADTACLSESRFSHVFREILGYSPVEYRDHLRVEHAKEYLSNTTMPIDRISEEVGFHNLSNFYAKFSQLVGQSPGKYRKKVSADSQISNSPDTKNQ